MDKKLLRKNRKSSTLDSKKVEWFIYDTNYRLESSLSSGVYSSFVVAKSKTHAENLIQQRNIGEWLQNSLPRKATTYRLKRLFLLPSVSYKQNKYLECLHGIIFLSWICGKAGTLDPLEALKDNGVLHEVLHKKMFGVDGDDSMFYHESFDNHVIKLLKELESKTPGLLPQK